MNDDHDFDENGFCTKCGCSALQAIGKDLECKTADNLLPISHIIAERRLAALIKKVPF